MKPMVFIGQVYDVRVKRNGGRLTIDFGTESIEVVNEIARLSAQRDMNLTFAVVDPDAPVEEAHDEETE